MTGNMAALYGAIAYIIGSVIGWCMRGQYEQDHAKPTDLQRPQTRVMLEAERNKV